MADEGGTAGAYTDTREQLAAVGRERELPATSWLRPEPATSPRRRLPAVVIAIASAVLIAGIFLGYRRSLRV